MIFDAFCLFFPEKMEDYENLAKLLKAALRHKSELQESVGTEVGTLAEVVTEGGPPNFTTWDEQALMNYKAKCRGTGKFMRQFGLMHVGKTILARVDAAFALCKKNKALSDALARLQSELASDSWRSQLVSENVADLHKMRARIMKIQKEKDAAVEGMESSMKDGYAGALGVMEQALKEGIASIFNRIDLRFDVAVGSCIMGAWNLESGKAKSLADETRATLVQKDTSAKEQLEAAAAMVNEFALEQLVTEAAPFVPRKRSSASSSTC